MPPRAPFVRKPSRLGLDSAKAAVDDGAAATTVAATPSTAGGAWSIKAVQRRGSVCTDAAHAGECMDLHLCPAGPAPRQASAPADLDASAAAFAACVAAAACGLSLSLDLELSPAEDGWLVQAPALLPTAASASASASEPAAARHEPVTAIAAAPCPAMPAPVPAPAQPPASRCTATAAVAAAPAKGPRAARLLRAMRSCGRSLAAGCKRLGACIAAPRTAEPACGGCPGRRLGNAASDEWKVTHVNWS